MVTAKSSSSKPVTVSLKSAVIEKAPFCGAEGPARMAVGAVWSTAIENVGEAALPSVEVPVAASSGTLTVRVPSNPAVGVIVAV